MSAMDVYELFDGLNINGVNYNCIILGISKVRPIIQCKV